MTEALTMGVTVKDVMVVELKYPMNPLRAIDDGALFDTRVRMALELLKAGRVPMHDEADELGKSRLLEHGERADYALDLADALVTRAESRGWVQTLPTDDSTMPKYLKRHAELQAKLQVHANHAAMREQREMGGGVAVPGGGGMHG